MYTILRDIYNFLWERIASKAKYK